MAREQKYNERVFHVHPASILPGVLMAVFLTPAGIMCSVCFFLRRTRAKFRQNFAILWGGATTTTGVFNSNLLHAIPG